jgi:hypothetical protein
VGVAFELPTYSKPFLIRSNWGGGIRINQSELMEQKKKKRKQQKNWRFNDIVVVMNINNKI